MGGSFAGKKRKRRQFHHNGIHSFLSVVFSACTSRSKCFLDVFFNISTPFGMNGTALQIPPDTISALSFVLLTPGVTSVVTPGAVPASVFTNHRNFEDCDAWFSKISPFLF